MTVRSYGLVWAALNLIGEQDSAFESPAGVGGWTALTNCTLARSTTNPDTGLAGLQMTATAGATMTARSGVFAVLPSTAMSGRARLRAATTGRTCRVGVQFLTSDGVTTTGSLTYGSTQADNNAGYVDVLVLNTTSPADAAYAYLVVEVQSAGAAEVHRVDTIQYGVGATNVTWASGVGDVFDYWELQRDDGAGYVTIAEIQSPSVMGCADYEMRRNVVSSYRLRYVLTDGSPSAWSTVLTVTVPMDACKLQFVSNFDPTLNQEWTDLTPRSYELLDAADVSYVQFHGRDYQVQQRPTETRGDEFVANLLLYGLPQTAPSTIGRRAFDTLEAIATSSEIPYVTVCDYDGNRWYAGLRLPSLQRLEPAGQYTAPVTVTEVADEPTPFDVV